MKLLKNAATASSTTSPSAVKTSGGISDVGLRRCHLTGIAEAEDAAQALLTNRCPDRPNGCADHGSRNVIEGVLPPRAAMPSRSHSSMLQEWIGCTQE